MNKEKKVAVVDIDGILWLMGPVWDEELQDINPKCPPAGTTKWDFYKDFMTDEQMQYTAKRVHMKQMIFKCFPSAYKLTKLLREAHYKVIIASHRDPKSYGATRIWLDDNKILFDELYTGFDKHPLVEAADLFIDDSPTSQKYALDKNIPTFSIEYAYNKHMKDEGVIMAKDLDTLITNLTQWLEDNK